LLNKYFFINFALFLLIRTGTIRLNNLNEDELASNFDRSSIYSSCSLRLSTSSHLSSFNLCRTSNGGNNHCGEASDEYAERGTVRLLSKNETFKIESCYQSIGSNIYSSKCMADLYFTNLNNLIKLLDWTHHESNGIPVWLFNTGLNPKRPKGLSLVIADKSTGFSLWKLNNITYVNDFKWTKPGHVTFKIFSNNLDLNENSLLASGKDSLKKKRSSNSKKEKYNGNSAQNLFVYLNYFCY
jgi:hypothetical protein